MNARLRLTKYRMKSLNARCVSDDCSPAAQTDKLSTQCIAYGSQDIIFKNKYSPAAYNTRKECFAWGSQCR